MLIDLIGPTSMNHSETTYCKKLEVNCAPFSLLKTKARAKGWLVVTPLTSDNQFATFRY